MDRHNCRAMLAKQPEVTQSMPSKAINHGAWQNHANHSRFLDALTNFMNASWTVVCQVRERSGLNSEYEMSSTEIAKRIDDVSKRLDEKYKEVALLEEQKSLWLTKSNSGTPGPSGAASSSGPKSTASDLQAVTCTSYPGGGSAGGWSASGGGSSRKKMQYSGSSTAACPPSCLDYSQGGGGGGYGY